MSNLSKINCCTANKHTFVPSGWKISQTKHSAVEFVCQNCLLAVTKQDIEVIAQQRAESTKRT